MPLLNPAWGCKLTRMEGSREEVQAIVGEVHVWVGAISRNWFAHPVLGPQTALLPTQLSPLCRKEKCATALFLASRKFMVGGPRLQTRLKKSKDTRQENIPAGSSLAL